MSKVTRLQTRRFLLGHPAPLPANQLPTKGDVVSYIRWLSRTSTQPPTDHIFRQVAHDVSDVWINEGIPIHDIYYVTKAVKRDCYVAYRKVCKKNKKARKGHIDSYFVKLFDLAKCKCRTWLSCLCPKANKVPQEEFSFLQDQRRQRKLSLGSFDRLTSSARTAREDRRSARRRHEFGGPSGGAEAYTVEPVSPPTDPESSLAQPESPSTEPGSPAGPSTAADPATAPESVPGPSRYDTGSGGGEFTASSTSDQGVDSDGDLFVPDKTVDTATVDRNTQQPKNAALAAERFDVSNRAAAAIIQRLSGRHR